MLTDPTSPCQISVLEVPGQVFPTGSGEKPFSGARMAILSNAAVAGRRYISGLGRPLRRAPRCGLLLNIHRSPSRGAWDLVGINRSDGRIPASR
ncbi:hypothetical protein U1Q18_009144 [Sarracenia purpurea var. burkii]